MNLKSAFVAAALSIIAFVSSEALSLTLTMKAPANGATISGKVTVSVGLSSTSGVSAVNFFRAPYNTSTSTCATGSYTQIGSAAPALTTSITYDTTKVSNGNYCFWTTTTGIVAASNIIWDKISNTAQACTPVSPMTQTDSSGWNMLTYFNNDNPGGQGPYKDAGRWTSSWYFINLAYLGYVDLMPSTVKGYVTYYLQHVNSDYSIQATSDSDDSFAATLLSLASAYYRVSCDKNYFYSSVYIPSVGGNVQVLLALKNIATRNLVNPRIPLGGGSLVRVFQSPARNPVYYNVAYVEDNSEDYKGLKDFGNLLSSIGDPSASTYLNSAAAIPPAVAATYTSNEWGGVPGFRNMVQISNGVVTVVNLSSTPVFYPDCVSGLFPQTYRMGLSQTMYNGGWQFMRTFCPSFQTYAYDSDPWTLLGLTAAYNGDRTTAINMLNKTKQDPGIPIHQMGFYRRTVLYLNNGFVY